MARTGACLSLLLTLATQAMASASEAAPAPQCRRSGDILVISRDRIDAAGQDIYVTKLGKAAAGAPCLYKPNVGDLRLGQGGDRYVAAMAGPLLALDSGTGPDRNLVIYDVSTRRKLIDTAYDDARKVVADAGTLTYWRVAAKPVAPATCPPAWRAAPDNEDAKQAHRSYEVHLSLADSKPHDTGVTGCVRLQADM